MVFAWLAGKFKQNFRTQADIQNQVILMGLHGPEGEFSCHRKKTSACSQNQATQALKRIPRQLEEQTSTAADAIRDNSYDKRCSSSSSSNANANSNEHNNDSEGDSDSDGNNRNGGNASTNRRTRRSATAGAIGQERPIGAHGARRQQGRSARSVH
eukprot:gene16998-biopygen12330